MMKNKTVSGHGKKILFVTALLCLLLAGIYGTAAAENEPDTEGPLTGKSAEEITEQMGIGWNLGNTFDATGGNSTDIFSQEQSWGNPIVTKELIDTVKEAGFTTIRIPVTWYKHLSDDGAYTIDPEFLERVKTVVDYAYEDGFFIILNIHHEAWVNTPELSTDYEELGTELAAIWLQLSDYFADYDQHLIFEGMNEPRMAGTDAEWSGNQEAYAAVNYLNQIFVNAVRSSEKGYNQERCLMIPGYAASSSSTVMSSVALPTVNGEAANNLIVSVHCYSPYNFCLSDTMKDFDPESSECVGEIDTIFSNIETLFLDNGIPVVIGETSATSKNNTEAREKWAYYMGSKAAAYGVPIVIWDNGSNTNSGGESHAYIDRAVNEWNYPTVIEALLSGLRSTEWGSGRNGGSEQASSIIGGSVIWSDSDGLTSENLWDNSFIALGAEESWFVEGREIAVIYSGGGEPKLVLDSEEKSAWWILVDPDRIETEGDYQVAYFGYASMISAMESAGVEKPSQLRNLTLVAANDNITVYELCAVGSKQFITFKVNGANYYIGSDIPENPEFTNMEFGGWYTTKDYQPGTEFTGAEQESDITVYAKFMLTLDMEELAAGFEEIRNSGGETTPEATPSVTATKPAENTGAKPTEKAEEKANGDGENNFPWVIVVVIAVVAVVAAAAAVVLKFKNKKK